MLDLGMSEELMESNNKLKCVSLSSNLFQIGTYHLNKKFLLLYSKSAGWNICT